MDMKMFLENKVAEFRDRGTIHMAKECESLLNNPPEDFSSIIEDVKRKRSECERFSVDFQYYWSLLTYFEDMQFHFSNQEDESDGSS